MAIDTRNKRASALGFGLVCLLQLPLADGTIDAADRQQMSSAYSGIAATGSSINTRDRRASASVVGQTWQIQPPLADGAITGNDREHPLALYSGISATIVSGIDTRDKRASAMGFRQPWIFGPPLADGSLAPVADRQQISHSYRGVVAATASNPVALSASKVGVITSQLTGYSVSGDAGGPGGDDGIVALAGTWTAALVQPVPVATSNSRVALIGVATAVTITSSVGATSSENVTVTGAWTGTNVTAGLTLVGTSSEAVQVTGDFTATTITPGVAGGGISQGFVELTGQFVAAVVGEPSPCIVWEMRPSTGVAEMTGKQALDLLMFRMGRNNNAELRAAAASEMQLAQQVLEGGPIKPWFLFTDHTCDAFRTAPDIERVRMPVGFLGMDEDLGAILYFHDEQLSGPDPWRELDMKRLRDMRRDFVGAASGVPEKFDFVSNFAYFRPVPNAIYNLRVFGAFVDAIPGDTDLTNQWLIYAPDWLIAATGIQVAIKHVKDFELANEFRQDEQVARGRVQLEHQRRAHTGRLYSMGD